MFKLFYPDEYVESSYIIDFKAYYDTGYRGILFDIDNTLVGHGKPFEKRVEVLFENLRDLGFATCLISNNQEPRVAPFANLVKSPYISNAHKPSRKNYRRGMAIMRTNRRNTLFIGDQLFTDVYGAKRTGIFSILVKPIHPSEEIQIVLKRFLEKIILYFYNKQKKDKRK